MSLRSVDAHARAGFDSPPAASTMNAFKYAYYAALPLLAFREFMYVCVNTSRVPDVDSGTVATIAVVASYLDGVHRPESTRRNLRHSPLWKS